MQKQNNMRQIAKIKLQELRRQRDALCKYYDELDQKAKAAKTPIETLKILTEGLTTASFGKRSLHPDIANMRSLLLAIEAGGEESQDLSEWIRRLENERKQGKARAEFAYVFGALLDTWSAEPEEHLAQEEPVYPPLADMLIASWKKTPPAIDKKLFYDLHKSFQDELQSAKIDLQNLVKQDLESVVGLEELEILFTKVGKSIYRKPSVRQQALAIAADDQQRNEYRGALTILLENSRRWNWPKEGVQLRTLWTRNKWRSYIDEDLLTALFLELIGMRWAKILEEVYRRKLNSMLFYGKRSKTDKNLPPYLASYSPFLVSRGFSLYHFFLSFLQEEQVYEDDGTGNFLHLNVSQRLLNQLSAEIQTRKKALPNESFYVVKLDLKDFSTSISHKLILYCCETLGIDEKWRSFFQTFLTPTIKYQQKSYRATHGLFPDHGLTSVFFEIILFFFDLYIKKETNERSIRLLDDIFFITSSQEVNTKIFIAAKDFCQATGLSLNLEKCGSICVGGKNWRPKTFPRKKPRLGALVLSNNGTWEVDEPTVKKLETHLAKLLRTPQPILMKVSRYNAYARFLLHMLSPFALRNPDHLEKIGTRMGQFHDKLFGEFGITQELRNQVATQFLHQDQAWNIPDAWLYWPLTAGGLGLFNPMIMLAAFQESLQKLPPLLVPPTPLSSWEERNTQWVAYFRKLNREFMPKTPTSTPAMESFLADFISRSGEVSGTEKETIAPYWQWIVYCFGPQILERFGTFRFLVTELVPLHLIIQNNIISSSLYEPLDIHTQ